MPERHLPTPVLLTSMEQHPQKTKDAPERRPVCGWPSVVLWNRMPQVTPAPGRGRPPLTRRQEEGAPHAALLQPDPPHAGGREPPLHLGLGHHRPVDGAGLAVALVNQHLHLHRGAGAAGNEPLVRPLHARGGQAPEEPHRLHAGVVPAVRGVRAQVQLAAAVRPVVRARLEEAAPLVGHHRPQRHRLSRAQPRHPRVHPLVRQPGCGGHGHADRPARRGTAQRPRGGLGGDRRSPHDGGAGPRAAEQAEATTTAAAPARQPQSRAEPSRPAGVSAAPTRGRRGGYASLTARLRAASRRPGPALGPRVRWAAERLAEPFPPAASRPACTNQPLLELTFHFNELEKRGECKVH